MEHLYYSVVASVTTLGHTKIPHDVCYVILVAKLSMAFKLTNYE